MKDLEILKALYHGNHLDDKELERAEKLLNLLRAALRDRV